MAPLNPISTWNVRGIAGERKPRVHWFFVCEGSQTERLYFGSLFELLDEKGLPVFAEGIYVNRTGKDKTASNPKNSWGRQMPWSRTLAGISATKKTGM